ncbi:hypothetical protein DIPPA_15608 [Diplonema papillatum]|nr:hypothetical protein DIPPA_15608 [Diplonema papillatum]|eukprot:gene21558-33166_t
MGDIGRSPSTFTVGSPFKGARPVRGAPLKPEEAGFVRANVCQALLLVFLGMAMFATHVAAMAKSDSWVAIEESLRYASGNLPPGGDVLTGTYPSVNVCRAVAVTAPEVFGFVWSPAKTAAFPSVECEFKRYGTPLESLARVNRTAVIKSARGAACGFFDCRNTPRGGAADLYDCGGLQAAVRCFQAFSILASLLLGVHVVLQALLWTGEFGARVAPALLWLPKTYCAQAFFLSLTWIFLAVGYRASFCGRRVRDVASLSYGLWFCVTNTVLCYSCHALTTSAYFYSEPTPETLPADSQAQPPSGFPSGI